MVDRLQKSDGRPYVDTGDDEFLNTEGRHLKLLNNIEGWEIIARIVRIASESEYGGWYMEADGVDYDHSEDSSKYSLLSDNKVESRIQDDSLTSDHGIPSDSDDCNRDVVILGQLEEFKKEAERMQYGSIAGDE